MAESKSGVAVESIDRLPSRLANLALPPERIGKTAYRIRTAIVQSQHVTYQQKTHVFGHIAPTVGGTWNGYGSVYGGGGLIGSKSESVVQMVYCDSDGCENTAELPASISAREGSIMRLDFLNDHLFAAQNLSGRQDIRGLLGPSHFIPSPAWSGRKTVLLVIALGCVVFHNPVAAAVFAAYPALVIYQRQVAKRERAALGAYMGRALSATPA